MDIKIPKPKTFFYNLDILRFIAFFAVFISHIPFGIDNKLFQFYVHQGRVGVDLFFVISGFLITYLLLKEKELFSNVNLYNFFVRRSLRIYPLYFGILLILTVFSLLFVNSTNFVIPKSWGLYYIFMGNFDRVFNDAATLNQFPGSGVLWSISVEEQFYVFIPLLIFFINKYRLFLFSLLFLHFVTYLYKFWVINTYTDFNLAYRTLYFHSICQFSLISLGCILAYIAYFQRDLTERLANFLTTSKIILLTFFFFFINFFIFKLGNVYFETTIATESFGFIFALIIIYVCFNKKANSESQNPIIKSLNHLGKISYGLYIYHVPCLLILEFLGVSSPVILFISGLLLTILVSHISYKYFEAFFIKFKEKFAVIRTRN